MRWKVMITAPYMQPVVDRFRPIFEENEIEVFAPPVEERLEETDLLPLIHDVDGVICGDDRFTEHVLKSAPRLKVLSKWGTGIDSIDRAACERLGIAVRNTPNAFSEPVADSVMGYILCFARNLIFQDRHMKAGTWQKAPGRTLREYTLGVIGLGNVGKAVIRRGVSFGMRVLGNDLLDKSSDFPAGSGVELSRRDDLLRQSDFVSLHCDLNPTSHHLMSGAQFELMKPTACLINTARGPVVDEPALIRALQEKRIAGAALDVFEIEPLPEESPLHQMENVLLAPHNANSSPDAWEKVHWSTINHLIEELRKRR